MNSDEASFNPQNIEVLIVEDSPTQAEKLRHLIERAGYSASVANNGRVALESIKTKPVQLVLSDIVMPEMDGYALCHAIKTDPAIAHIPVILLTTLADPKDIVRGLDCGADNFIRKPYEAEHLLARIQHVLVNRALRKHRNSGGIGIEIFLGGQRHFISAERQQILDLLISTFEQAVRVNEELKAREQQISELNALLERQAEELKDANRALATTNTELENASQAKLRFFAHMSHELRTPLNAVIGFSELLREGVAGELNPGQKNHIDSIFQSGNYLLSLINDTLDLAKIEAHKMELQPSDVDVPLLLKNCLPMVREQAAARRINLQLNIDPAVNDAWMDERKVTQIVINLLSNAVKFTPDNGSVIVAAELVERDEKNLLSITVTDTGIGIAEEDIPKLFRSFEQLENNSKQRIQGTGLGLSLVKQLAELHGGCVTVRSVINRGSSFTVYLPLRVTAANVSAQLKFR
ncbi:MAG: histidine kinase [Verrucomicrobiaceae bacterium]|nr:histidine kinase [Verrucomicrobiaceae bacterium]